ncbi:hypothetical protein GCM10022222_13000 [Amycolatopsis ultiminotia]|uniref:Uncharacterized protein n=1 Tax=Amycolatopsis ultiminotia TaxID=543629 RepID=A0ABP6VD76_9PSEU
MRPLWTIPIRTAACIRRCGQWQWETGQFRDTTAPGVTPDRPFAPFRRCPPEHPEQFRNPDRGYAGGYPPRRRGRHNTRKSVIGDPTAEIVTVWLPESGDRTGVGHYAAPTTSVGIRKAAPDSVFHENSIAPEPGGPGGAERILRPR